MINYLHGCAVLGMDYRPGEQYVVIKIRDISKAVADSAGGGSTGKAATSVLSALTKYAPKTIDDFVVKQVVPELKKKLAENGVIADVEAVTTPPAQGQRTESEFGKGALVGAVGVGAAWMIKAFLF